MIGKEFSFARCAAIGAVFTAVLTSPVLCQQGIITTVAGTGLTGFTGDGGPATSARLGAGPGTGATLGVSVDNSGNLLIVDGGNRRIRKVNAAGIITTVAGGGPATGDGGLATGAQIFPGSVTADSAGNLYIAQGASIRKVNTSGIVSTVAGTGLPGFSGDGGPAIAATFFATNVAVDGAGNLYISDSLNQRIRKVDTAGIITTFAGSGTQGFSGDGGPATAAKLALPQGVTVDSAGSVFFADGFNGRIRKVDTAGTITTVAGSGSPLSLGDGGPATSAGMTPVWVAADKDGNLYIADSGGKRIRKVNTAGIIGTLAGGALNTGLGNGDGGPATNAVLTGVSAVAVDNNGNVYIADPSANNVRKVSSGVSGSPIAASPASLSFSYTVGDNAPPGQTVVIISPGATLTFTAAASTTDKGNWLAVNPPSGNVDTVLTINVNPAGLAAGTYTGTIAISPSGTGNTPLTIPVRLSVNTPVTQGVISTVAGNGLTPFSGDGGAATKASLGVNALAVDGSGNIYVADMVSNRVLKVGASGIISAFAGNGAYSFSGDGGPATSAAVFGPSGVAVDGAGNVFISDTTNNRIRKVSAAGIMSTVAGTGSPAFSGDGGPATSAAISSPTSVALDGAGNLYFTDAGNNRVRRINTSGVIATIAGGAIPGFSGDGGAATSASLFLPGGLAVDGAGNIYIDDVANNRIRKVNAAGIISTVAGSGVKGFAGDGGAATAASLNQLGAHAGLAADNKGNLYIADISNHRIRKVDASGIITTVAGNGIGGFSGDGSPAVTAGLNNPADVAVDSAGNLAIADTSNNRIRKVTFAGGAAPPSISANGVVNGASFRPGLVANSWATILGTGLSAVSDTWANSIVNGKLPTSLGGVTVTIGGKPAYLYYVSPAQINLVAPDIAPGSTQVTVTTPAGTSSTFTVVSAEYAPAFFAWPGNQVVATRQDFSFAARSGTFDGASTVPSKPGDVIILWGTGFGPTAPAAPVGFQVPSDRTYSTSTLPAVTINNVQVTLYGAALAPGFAGLYQVAIQVPSSLADGDWLVVTSIGGVQSSNAMVLSVRR